MIFVEASKPKVTIFISEKANDTDLFAAQELSNYIYKISTARLPVCKAKGFPRKPCILVGKGKWISSLDFKDIDQLVEDEYIIHSSQDILSLIGGSHRGTLYSVYDFLKLLGCRWIAPSFEFYAGVAEEIPKCRDVRIKEMHIRQKPCLKYRKKYIEEGDTHDLKRIIALVDWMAKNKMNIFVCPMDCFHQGKVKWDNWRDNLIPELKKRGIITEIGGHGYENYLPPERYYSLHPEWFGIVEGERSFNPRIVFCTSNLKAREQFAANIIDYLKIHPEIDIFDFWPPDEERWCECKGCQKLGDPSKRHALLVNFVAKRLRESDLKMEVEFLAYSNYTEPPIDISFDENTQMDFCPIRRSFQDLIFDDKCKVNSKYDSALKKWLKAYKGDISILSYYRKYSWRSLPVIIPHLIAKEITYFFKLGIKGIGSYSEPGDWLTYELNHFIISSFSWNCNHNVDELIEDYCKSRFKQAWRQMKDFFSILESSLPQLFPGFAADYSNIGRLKKLSAQLARARGKLSEAKKLIKNDNLCHILKSIEANLKYAELDIKIHLFSQVGKKEEFLRTKQELEEIIEKNFDKGIFVASKIQRELKKLAD